MSLSLKRFPAQPTAERPHWEQVRARVLERVDSEINYAASRDCGEKTLRAYRLRRTNLAAVSDPAFWARHERTGAFWLLETDDLLGAREAVAA